MASGLNRVKEAWLSMIDVYGHDPGFGAWKERLDLLSVPMTCSVISCMFLPTIPCHFGHFGLDSNNDQEYAGRAF